MKKVYARFLVLSIDIFKLYNAPYIPMPEGRGSTARLGSEDPTEQLLYVDFQTRVV